MMNLNITLIKKFNFDILALYPFFRLEDITAVYADDFNYDDSHEVLVTRIDTIYDFYSLDHHFLYTSILYLLDYVIPFSTLQIVNLFLF